MSEVTSQRSVSVPRLREKAAKDPAAAGVPEPPSHKAMAGQAP